MLDVIDRGTRKKIGRCEVPVEVADTSESSFEAVTKFEERCEIKSTERGAKDSQVIGQ